MRTPIATQRKSCVVSIPLFRDSVWAKFWKMGPGYCWRKRRPMAIQRKKLRRFRYRFIAIQFSKNGQTPKERTGLALAKFRAPLASRPENCFVFWLSPALPSGRKFASGEFRYRHMAIQLPKMAKFRKSEPDWRWRKFGPLLPSRPEKCLVFGFFHRFQSAKIARAGKVVAVSSPALGDSVSGKLPNREERNQNCKRYLLLLNLKS